MGSSVILPQPGQPGPLKEGEFIGGATPNIVTFGLQEVAPPSPLYIQRDDQLILQAATRIIGETVIFNYRLLQPYQPVGGQPTKTGEQPAPFSPVLAGYIVRGQQIIAPAIGGSVTTNPIALSEGYLLSIAAVGQQASFRGQTYARAGISKQGAPVFPFVLPLFADYCTLLNPCGWPYGRILAPSESTGWVHSLQQGNPAVGTDFILQCGAQQRLAVRSFSATFTASAGAANRNINVIVDDGVNTVWQDDVSVAVTATQVVSVNVTQTNVVTGIVATELFAVLPPGLVLEAGWRIRSSTANIQVGDQWSNIWFNVEEQIDGV